jgi:hypothetical protein
MATSFYTPMVHAKLIAKTVAQVTAKSLHTTRCSATVVASHRWSAKLFNLFNEFFYFLSN